MIIIIYGFTIFLCIVGMLIKPKNNILQYVVLCFIAFMMGRGAITHDNLNYQILYSYAEFMDLKDTYEPGYLFLSKIGIYFDLDYIQYRTLIVFLSLLLMNRLVKKIAKRNSFYFYFLFCFMSIFIESEQLRSFIAFSIVAYGLSFFLFSQKKIPTIIYIICVILASTVHISSLAYLILLLVKFKNRKKLIRLIVWFSIIACFGIFTGILNIGFVKNILSSIAEGGDGRLDAYGSISVNLGFMYAFVLNILSLGLLYFLATNSSKEYRQYVIRGYENNELKIKNSILEFVILINLVSIIYFPLYMFDLQFIRLSRNILLINLMTFAMFFLRYRYVKINSALILTLSMIVISFWFYFHFVIGDHIEDIIIPFFQEENILS